MYVAAMVDDASDRALVVVASSPASRRGRPQDTHPDSNIPMPVVLNKLSHGMPAGAVYIGRGGPWGNPFVIGQHGDRASVIAQYNTWMASQPELVARARRDLAGKDLVCFCAPLACHGDTLLAIANSPDPETASSPQQHTWARFGGYEVSSKGDHRFSAFHARLRDGRTIEAHYQCDIKGYQPGGADWRLGKGKPPIRAGVDLLAEYVGLWREWAAMNPSLLEELRRHPVLSDRFATTPVNQAHALAIILNETVSTHHSVTLPPKLPSPRTR